MTDRTLARAPHETALAAAATACRNVAIVCLALMAVLIVAQVVGRNVFDLGMPWADELARFSGVAMVFLGAPFLALRGQHVAVDLVRDALPERPRRVALALGEAATLTFAALALWSLQTFLVRAGKFVTPTLGLSNWIFYAPAVIGMLLLALIALTRILAILVGRAPETGTTTKP